MNKEKRIILQMLKEYLTINPDVRFGQALFNMGINEFSDGANPGNLDWSLRDIHSDSDADILDRMRTAQKKQGEEFVRMFNEPQKKS